MEYKIRFTPFFEKQLKKLKKKDKNLFDRLTKKLKEIRRNPEYYKPLRNILKGNRRAHLDPFIIIFDVKEDLITVHYVKHHDKAYQIFKTKTYLLSLITIPSSFFLLNNNKPNKSPIKIPNINAEKNLLSI